MRCLESIGSTFFASLFLMGCLMGPVLADEDGTSSAGCGDEQTTCGLTEHCCEHIVAMFSDGGATAPSYREGKCIPHDQKCADFWCGNRHCEPGFFGAPTVCCITSRPDLPPEYKCSYSELSCPGNTQQLTIRDKQVADARPLQGY